MAVELHNTIYAAGGDAIDGLAVPDSAAAWLGGVRDRLPPGGTGSAPTTSELTQLRQAVRDALRAVIDGAVPPRESIEALNRCSVRAPSAPVATWRANSLPEGDRDYGGASRADIVLGSIAADAIRLVTGPDAAKLRSCGAPGCVLMFVKGHTRREWCSGSCGNRARQARHYRRTRDRASDRSD